MKRLALNVALGQILSLCLTLTNTSTSLLWLYYNVNVPPLQNLLNYVMLFSVYTTVHIHKHGRDAWKLMIRERAWKYILFAMADLQGNLFVLYAFRNTSILSAIVLLSWTVPCVVILSVLFTNTRYSAMQYAGVSICMTGLAVLIYGDYVNNRLETDNHSWIGDLSCLLGATLYAIANLLEEHLVLESPIEEVLGQLGMWGTLMCGLEVVLWERKAVALIPWSWNIVGLMLCYNFALFTMSSLVPILLQISSATFLNLSLLTSNFFSLVVGLALFNISIIPEYPISFTLAIIGITTFNLHSTNPVIHLDHHRLYHSITHDN
ncbi:hypothetical protein K450DRAFT_257129 [Umbelopsis ramanniana AG]|uniref:Solute carrier family 35 member F2 n=1 Tax=Umbelopsis ramanniana AG TaxID=1314678 RepID=A0AAD5H9P3_UMBRA|nr:uncharacterized protein K450DRAFT_257129 [Umbelopsis ramanniana AG]KAI8576405.1 hypothetical protein K450DRAFT_257129 [Umbelopsis ramanniana AG]